MFINNCQQPRKHSGKNEFNVLQKHIRQHHQQVKTCTTPQVLLIFDVFCTITTALATAADPASLREEEKLLIVFSLPLYAKNLKFVSVTK